MPKTMIGWDWKEAPSVEQFQRALEPFGVYVYEDPTSIGSDGYGFIFSDEELSDEELMEVAEGDWTNA